MTKDELIDQWAARLAERSPLTLLQFYNALDNATAEIRQQLVDAVNARDVKIVGDILVKIGNKKRRALAKTNIENLLADDTITTAELLQIL
jgi:triphosphoribosyl-dephospho-CoA synthetase